MYFIELVCNLFFKFYFIKDIFLNNDMTFRMQKEKQKYYR